MTTVYRKEFQILTIGNKKLREIFNEKNKQKTIPYTDWLSEVDEAWLYARARCSQIPCRGSSRGSRPGYAGWR